MPAVSILYLKDEVVAPHLELLRRICDPKSQSQPHVTVRFFDKLSVPERYCNKEIAYIDLLEPGAYGLDGEGQNAVVFIRCLSDDLLSLEHKPHFPTSDFHLTLYEGNDRKFARSLLYALRNYDWRFRVEMVDAKLTVVKVKSKNTYGPPAPKQYPRSVKEVFRAITGTELDLSTIDQISALRRLALARKICEHLHRAVSGYFKLPTYSSPRTSQSGESYLPFDKLSVHLTPPELAYDIAKFAFSKLDSLIPIHFGDPAVGTGVFFSALLQICPTDRLKSSIGIDVSEKQVAAAHWRWAPRGMQVLQADYLHLEKLPKRTFILANPPYLRHQEIPAAYKAELCERASVRLGYRVSGRSGLYAYFMLLGHDWMDREAVAGWLIPSEFMVTEYGSALRYYLSHKVELIRVHTFEAEMPQFENADVLPSIVVFRNRIPTDKSEAIFSVGGTLNSPVITQAISNNRLRTASKWKIPFNADDESARNQLRIRDLFKIRRGIATGANEFFVIERDVARKLGLPDIALKPVLPKSRSLKNPIIEREPDGYPRITPQLCVIDCNLSEIEIARKYKPLADYLSRAKSQGILGRNLLRSRRPWYKQEGRDPAPFLCTYMGRGTKDAPPIHFFLNKSDAIATNTYLMLYPHPSLSCILENNERLSKELLNMLQKAAATTLAEQSRVHAGGLRKIEPKELGNVRLVDVPEWVPKAEAFLTLSDDGNSGHGVVPAENRHQDEMRWESKK